MQKHKIIQWAFSIGQKQMLRKMFQSIDVQKVPFEEPLLIVVNHSNFYDSLVMFELEKRGLLPENVIAVMSENGLSEHKIFNGLGVIPVSNPVKLSEFKQMLNVMESNPLLLFPQGKEEHQEKRPISIEKGAATLLAKKSAHHILSISVYYTFTEQAKGRIFCRYHFVRADHRPSSVKDTHTFLEHVMTEQLDKVKKDVITGNVDNYERLWLS